MKDEGKFTKPITLVPLPKFLNGVWNEEPVPYKSLEDRNDARLAGNVQVPKPDNEKGHYDLDVAIKLLSDSEDTSCYQYSTEDKSKSVNIVQDTVKLPSNTKVADLDKLQAKPDPSTQFAALDEAVQELIALSQTPVCDVPARQPSALTPLDEGFVKAASKNKPLAPVKRVEPKSALAEVGLVGSDCPHVYAHKMRRIAHTPTQSTSSYYDRVTADSVRVLEASQKSHQVEQMHEKKDRLAGWFDKQSAVVHKHVISTFAKEQSRKRKAMNTQEYFKRAAKCAKLAPLVAVAAPEAVSTHRVTAHGKVSAPRASASVKLAKKPIQERIILKVNKGKNSDWTSRRVVNPGKRGS